MNSHPSNGTVNRTVAEAHVQRKAPLLMRHSAARTRTARPESLRVRPPRLRRYVPVAPDERQFAARARFPRAGPRAAPSAMDRRAWRRTRTEPFQSPSSRFGTSYQRFRPHQ
jgi:hypothetical protein